MEKIEEVSSVYPNWRVIPVGTMLWDYLAEVFLVTSWDPTKDGGKAPTNHEESRATMIKEVMTKGEMVPQVDR